MKRTGHVIHAAMLLMAVSTQTAPAAMDDPGNAARPIHLIGKTNVEIAGKAFSLVGRGAAEACIILDQCTNITIRSCRFADVPCQGVLIRQCEGVRISGNEFFGLGREKPCLGIDCYLSRNIRVIGNRIQRVASGAYFLQSTGILFASNDVQDVMGPIPRGEMVQFDEVYGEGNVICNNIAVNHWKRSKPADVISIYKSAGTVGSPIVIRDNWIMGDPESGSKDLLAIGSGIMLADGGGAHIVCSGNRLVSPGQVGIGVASGSNIVVIANVVLGRRSNRSNVGIYVWNQYPEPGGGVLIASNVVAWTNTRGEDSAFWNGAAKCGKAFEFTSVVLKDNVWNAWEEIGHLAAMPPMMDTVATNVPGSAR